MSARSRKRPDFGDRRMFASTVTKTAASARAKTSGGAARAVPINVTTRVKGKDLAAPSSFVQDTTRPLRPAPQRCIRRVPAQWPARLDVDKTFLISSVTSRLDGNPEKRLATRQGRSHTAIDFGLHPAGVNIRRLDSELGTQPVAWHVVHWGLRKVPHDRLGRSLSRRRSRENRQCEQQQRGRNELIHAHPFYDVRVGRLVSNQPKRRAPQWIGRLLHFFEFGVVGTPCVSFPGAMTAHSGTVPCIQEMRTGPIESRLCRYSAAWPARILDSPCQTSSPAPSAKQAGKERIPGSLT